MGSGSDSRSSGGEDSSSSSVEETEAILFQISRSLPHKVTHFACLIGESSAPGIMLNACFHDHLGSSADAKGGGELYGPLPLDWLPWTDHTESDEGHGMSYPFS
jgi:hypothetical protein